MKNNEAKNNSISRCKVYAREMLKMTFQSSRIEMIGYYWEGEIHCLGYILRNEDLEHEDR